MPSYDNCHVAPHSTFSLEVNDYLTLRRELNAYVLELGFKWTVDWSEPQLADHATVEVLRAAFQVRGVQSTEWSTLADLTPENVQRSLVKLGRDHPKSDTLVLSVRLSPADLGALERVRAGGDLHIRLFPSYRTSRFTRVAVGSVLTSLDIERRGASIEKVVPQSVWVNLLRDAGVMGRLLVEMPAVSPDDPEMAEVVSYFEAAYAAAQSGRYTDSIAKCRQTLERLSNTLRDEDYVQKNVLTDATTRGGLLQFTKLKRLQLVRRALYAYAASSAHSDDVAIAHDFDHDDAYGFLFMVGGVLRMTMKPSV